MKSATAICILFLIFPSLARSQKIFKLHYLGNMGIAIVHNDSTIIIDGLHDFYEPDYMPTDRNLLKAMLQRKKPFTNIIAIAVTHRHSDHFDSSVVTAVATVHSSALIMGSDQVSQQLGNGLQERAIMVSGSPVRVHRNLAIFLKKIPHVNPARHSAVDNIRVEIIWNGFRVIHLGDAAVVPDAVDGLKENPDALIMPDWLLATQATPILKKVNPANIIVTHISPISQASYKPKPPTTYFRRYGEMIILKSE